ncbi:hypothetical protein [Thermofilum pendens]|uniref:Uncharacterized protein n=1 Tax=Thermofilum pendens (strain DSM 2475 / Hrk 5) TaxID=368408 RepID=A1S1D6_THEPD|nr:hypothetical protein [Thermofilum pendens]ABL79266.1 hypothetical protein Tpen_1871 [Thermofilum pendens Hrk 5]
MSERRKEVVDRYLADSSYFSDYWREEVAEFWDYPLLSTLALSEDWVHLERELEKIGRAASERAAKRLVKEIREDFELEVELG